MKQEIAYQWADALESGKYKQGRHRLKSSENTFCCLGVLCDLFKEQVNSQWDLVGDPKFINTATAERTTSFLPVTIMGLTGISSVNGKIGGLGSKTLAQMNDAGATFSEIAQTIRENWEKL